MQRYNPKEIEPRWQKKWKETGIYRATEDPSKPKRYVLEYFPYPSGAAMHVGHVRNYTIGDVVARFYRMQGENVLHPMGWDAFGLPAENYAIKNNISPKQAIVENTAKFKQQLTQMGFSYDWSREIDSSDPSYYKWTQWFFKLLFERGLAYRKESLVNWDPIDKTVLANEQVIDGKAERSGAVVEKIPLAQWFFKITDYADRLADDLDKLDWSESIKTMQRNWIGKSKGAEIDFKIENADETVRVFTTRPDTLFGVTFMVLAPEHPLVQKITAADQKQAVEDYVKQAGAKSDIERQETNREKTGVFTGAYATNPVNGEKIPVWIADYVLMGYGTGAIMAVPAHDERDNEFAKKFDLPIVQVIAPQLLDQENPPKPGKKDTDRNVAMCLIKHPTEDLYLTLKWKKFNWHNFVMGGIEDGEEPATAAQREITEETGYTDMKLVDTLPVVMNSKFYAAHKDVNRNIYTTVFLFQLNSLDQIDTQREAHEDFESVWVRPDELPDLRPVSELPYILEWLEKDSILFSGDGALIHSGKYSGMDSSTAREQIVADITSQHVGQEKINYKIRDWLISRQRYWGAPIPIIWVDAAAANLTSKLMEAAQKHGQLKVADGKELIAVPVPDAFLPVVLPEVDSYKPDGSGKGPLARSEDWVHVWMNTDTGETVPHSQGKPGNGSWAEGWRETDTMDGFACSSWYFLRFADPHNENEPFSPEKAKFWLPVDDYIGGAEHAVMHLLYARMWTKVMYDAGLIEFDEPFKALRNQGMILAPDGRKMSKSWGNVIAPDEIIDQGYGADAIRLMELFIGPWDQSANWSVEGMGGTFRFLQRVWTLTHEFLEASGVGSGEQKELLPITHKAIKKVTEDLRHMGFNTAIAALMEMTNELYKVKADSGFVDKSNWKFTLQSLVQLLAPFAPHITEELWQQLGNAESVHISDWPVYDEKYLVSDTMNIVVQVNGKVRANITVSTDADQEAIETAAKVEAKVQEHLQQKEVRKTIYVPRKLINFVV